MDIDSLVLELQRLLGFSLPGAASNNTWSRVADLQNHVPARYPGKVILFRATDVPQLPGGDETLGWKEILDGGVEVVFVPGDHESMFHDLHVDFCRRRLRQALQISDRGRGAAMCDSRLHPVQSPTSRPTKEAIRKE